MRRLPFALLLALLAFVSTATPPSAAATTLLVADLRRVPVDDQMAFTALQGLVNRASPRIYYVGLGGGQDYVTEPTGELWLRDAVPLPKKRIGDPYELL